MVDRMQEHTGGVQSSLIPAELPCDLPIPDDTAQLSASRLQPRLSSQHNLRRIAAPRPCAVRQGVRPAPLSTHFGIALSHARPSDSCRGFKPR